jgi:TRL-like protein family
MKNLTRLFIILLTLGLLNCATGPTHGALFTYNTFPGNFNPSNEVKVTKTASGCQHSVLFLFAFGSASAGQVASENGIQRIATIDHSTLSVLSLVYRNYCTIVSGEGK